MSENIKSEEVDNNAVRGKIGEDIACVYLIKNGFSIVSRNYRKKWGELDIVAKKSQAFHFFEVKSVTFGFDLEKRSQISFHRPEDNVHGLKIRHIRKMIETFLWENCGNIDQVFFFHVICVFLDRKRRVGRVKVVENVIV